MKEIIGLGSISQFYGLVGFRVCQVFLEVGIFLFGFLGFILWTLWQLFVFIQGFFVWFVVLRVGSYGLDIILVFEEGGFFFFLEGICIFFDLVLFLFVGVVCRVGRVLVIDVFIVFVIFYRSGMFKLFGIFCQFCGRE